jgi:hypothetical protein
MTSMFFPSRASLENLLEWSFPFPLSQQVALFPAQASLQRKRVTRTTTVRDDDGEQPEEKGAFFPALNPASSGVEEARGRRVKRKRFW